MCQNQTSRKRTRNSLAYISGTHENQLARKSVPELSKAVQLHECIKLPCVLKKNTDQHIVIKFTPEKDVLDLKNSVSAKLFEIDLPFIGVDGTSVCDKIHTEDDQKSGCPLKAGTNYIYKDTFPILSIYPSIQAEVTWALKAEDKDVICFRVPVKIS